jgi:hypothetical protein
MRSKVTHMGRVKQIALALGNRACRPVTIVWSVIAVFLLAPRSAQAQLGIGAVLAAASAVVDLIKNTIGPLLNTAISVLGDINGIAQAFSDLWQKVVYPIALIAQAQAMVAQIVAMFTGLAMSIHNVNVLSATLPNPTALEVLIRNRSVTDFAQFDQAFQQTYRPLPPATDIDPGDRQRVDMGDAMAMGTLKTLKSSDQVVEQTLQAARIIENEAQQAAPGSAPWLSAAGLIAAVENQAMMQRMVASATREEAAMLAHTNAIRKRHADVTSQLRQDAGLALK